MIVAKHCKVHQKYGVVPPDDNGYNEFWSVDTDSNLTSPGSVAIMYKTIWIMPVKTTIKLPTAEDTIHAVIYKSIVMNTNKIASILSVWRMCGGYDTKKSCSGWNLLAADHYNDVMVIKMASQIASRLLTQPFNQAQIKENIKAPPHWPLCWWIHRSPANSPHKRPVMILTLYGGTAYLHGVVLDITKPAMPCGPL